MRFNFCLVFDSVTRAVFSGNQICEILYHLLERFGFPPSQIICFDREQKTFLQFSLCFQYLIQKFSPSQKGWRTEPFPTYLYVCYLAEMTFVGSPCRWTGLGAFSTGLPPAIRFDHCMQSILQQKSHQIVIFWVIWRHVCQMLSWGKIIKGYQTGHL